MTKEAVINNFNPNGVGVRGSLFGLPFSPEHARLVVIPVPWEVTVSYSAGTAAGPQAVLEASPQIDYFETDIPDAWKMGISMLPIPEELQAESNRLREKAEAYITALEEDNLAAQSREVQEVPTEVNKASAEMIAWVKESAHKLLQEGKIPVVLGGDHSTPLGLMQAIAEEKGDFGILQIDAHADLREAYEGFTWSHASIMYNALQIPQVKKLVQLGIRDISEGEALMAREDERIAIYYDAALKHAAYEGKSWKQQVEEVIEQLPQQVYVSFDIDGLDPRLCPATGTPVPGGFEFEEAMYLLKAVVKSGRTIVGFDLCEVAPGEDEFNGNVGARVLYRLANLAGVSQQFLHFA